VLGPVVTLVCYLAQNLSAHRINLPINPEKALGSGSFQERLNTAIQQQAVEAVVAELDVILMMLGKGVHLKLDAMNALGYAFRSLPGAHLP
jgi:hypothetical protein